MATFALLAMSGAVTAQNRDHAYPSQDVEAGSKLYRRYCATCHGTNGEGVQGVNLADARFTRQRSDEELRSTMTDGIRGKAMPPFALPESELDGLVAYLRAGFDLSALAVPIGTASKGRHLFEGKGQCSTCHRVNGIGPRVAPDLSDIGAIRSPAQLHRSMTDPTSQMMPINRPVHVTTRNGTTYRGRRLNEDTYTVQIIDEGERLVSLDKSDIRQMELGKSSPMPPATRSLTGDEIADVIAYLISLQGQP